MYQIEGQRQRRKIRILPFLLVITALASYGYWTLGRPLPGLRPEQAVLRKQLQSTPGSLQWPLAGQAAVSVVGANLTETYNKPTPVPTASTAKIITALVVLQKKPLQKDEPGPIITLNTDDVARYRTYVAKSGSVVPVRSGEQITEYQMLQGILLPSANNMADSLAIWAYGSLEAYARAANAYLAKHKLNDTHVGNDASGLAADTTSTAQDLARLGELAMQNPVMAQIVGQSTATGIPIVGNIKNVNTLLGTNDIIGVKTGNSDEAGGAFVAAARVIVNNKPETIVTAVMKAANLQSAMKDSLPLIRSAQENFRPVSVTRTGDVVGRYKQPWGGSIEAISSEDLDPAAWKGSKVDVTANLINTRSEPQAGDTVGTLTAKTAAPAAQHKINIKLKSTPTQPTIMWRLTHPF